MIAIDLKSALKQARKYPRSFVLAIGSTLMLGDRHRICLELFLSLHNLVNRAERSALKKPPEFMEP